MNRIELDHGAYSFKGANCHVIVLIQLKSRSSITVCNEYGDIMGVVHTFDGLSKLIKKIEDGEFA